MHSNSPVLTEPFSMHVYSSTGLNPETKKIVDGTVADQARQLLMNMKAVVEAAGSDMSKVVKTTCFLADMSLFAEVCRERTSHLAKQESYCQNTKASASHSFVDHML